MATNKGKNQVTAVDLPECPVCLEAMKAPIFLCQSGHSLCNDCTRVLSPPNCPMCRQPMTQMRNRTLEEITEKAKVPCPNSGAGCVYALPAGAVAAHVRECIFRRMDCPLGTVFGKCSWTGQLQQMLDHFKEKHPDACDAGPEADADVELANVSLRECDRRLLLAARQRLLFIITVKIDTLQRMAYWAVQQIGPKKQAHQHLYEIHVQSKRDPQRKVIFTEHCFSDTIKVEDVIREGNCATLPLDMLAHFIKDDKLTFRYLIKRVNEPKTNQSEGANNNQGNARSASCTREGGGPQRPKPKGPWKGHGPKGPGPKGPGPKGPGPKGPGPNKNFNQS